MFKYRTIWVFTLLLAASTINLKSQSFELSRENASIVISGTSTLHDWKMSVRIFKCNANFTLKGSRLNGIDNVTFSCNATDLKSENSLMDKKAYSALKSREFPEIKFNTISEIEISPDNDKFRDSIRGNLSIAGKSMPVSIPFIGTLSNINGIGIIEVSGETELNMSDFNISPPVLMLGTLKTGDKITISFSLQFQQKAG